MSDLGNIVIKVLVERKIVPLGNNINSRKKKNSKNNELTIGLKYQRNNVIR